MNTGVYASGKVTAFILATAFCAVFAHTADTQLPTGKEVPLPKEPINFTKDIPLDVTRDPQEIADLVAKHEIERAQVLFDTLSWKAFIAINWPTPEKGKPAEKLGDNDSWRAWQYWRSSSSIFLPDGEKPQKWRGDLHKTPKMENIANQSLKGFNPNAALEAFTGPLVDQNGKWTRFDIRVNETEFDYLFDNELYSLNGQVAFSSGTGPHQGRGREPDTAVMMPLNSASTSGAIEVKLAWKEMGANDDCKRFYTTDIEVTTAEEHPVTKTIHVGLVGMHIAMRTQSSPEWIWSTFEQVDNVHSNPVGADGTMSHANFFNPASTAPANTLPPMNAYLDPSTNQLVPAIGTNANSWIESLTTVPTQVTRVVVPTQPGLNPWDATTAKIASQLNKLVEKQLAAEGSVFQYYQLIDTQWPLHPNFPAFAGGNNSSPESIRFKTPGDMIPVFLINTTMETYFQKGIQNSGSMEQDDRIGDNSIIDKTQIFGTESCVGCHYSAGIATGFKTKPETYAIALDPETGKPLPIFGENNHFGRTGGANFSWMLQLEPHAQKGMPEPLPYNVDLPVTTGGE